MSPEELIKMALKLLRFLTKQQRDIVQNMLVQYKMKGYLSESQLALLRAIAETAEIYQKLNLEGEND